MLSKKRFSTNCVYGWTKLLLSTKVSVFRGLWLHLCFPACTSWRQCQVHLDTLDNLVMSELPATALLCQALILNRSCALV